MKYIDDTLQFEEQVKSNIENIKNNENFKQKSLDWMVDSFRSNYSYNFKWMGLPIIQYPADIVAMQEIIWNVKPDCIIETGIARGGSAIFYSSMLELLQNSGKVISIDIDIREHNRKAVERHPMFKNIILIEGSSIDDTTIDAVKSNMQKNNLKKALLVLDSHHTHDHVLQELHLYSQFVEKGSYICAFDTIVEDLPEDVIIDRPWSKGNSPRTAAIEFLKENKRFELDDVVNEKLLLTVSYGGYLKCIE